MAHMNCRAGAGQAPRGPRWDGAYFLRGVVTDYFSLFAWGMQKLHSGGGAQTMFPLRGASGRGTVSLKEHLRVAQREHRCRAQRDQQGWVSKISRAESKIKKAGARRRVKGLAPSSCARAGRPCSAFAFNRLAAADLTARRRVLGWKFSAGLDFHSNSPVQCGAAGAAVDVACGTGAVPEPKLTVSKTRIAH